MQKLLVWRAFVACLLLLTCRSHAAEAAQIGPSAADLIETLEPSVVNIAILSYVKTPAGAGNMAGQPSVVEHTEQGSGFFVREDGVIATNFHVLAGASDISVILTDGTRLKAALLARATQSDIALLKINAGRPMPVVTFGDSDRLRPGDPVFLIGNPLGQGNSVSAGIVSALDRNTAQSKFGSFFQLDASLNHGNSGGPVFNAGGEMVGMATALFSPDGETGSVGLGLAIPANDARLIVTSLLKYGRVQLGAIGVHVQPVTADIAEAVALPLVAGSIVTGIDDDSPATRAGLQDGDVILKLDDDSVAEPRILSRRIAASAIGGVVKLGIWRDGTQQTVPIVIGPSPANEDAPASLPAAVPAAAPDLGLLLGPITDSLREKLALPPHQTGVAVIDVAAGSIAADRGITAGSLIIDVRQKKVATPAEIQSAIAAARQEHRSSLLVLVRNAQGQRFVTLPLGPQAPR